MKSLLLESKGSISQLKNQVITITYYLESVVGNEVI